MQIEHDCHGCEILGCDDDGFWWGTPNAWHVVGDDDTSGCDHNGVPDGSPDGPEHPPATPTYFEVSGWMGAVEFTAYVIASNEANVRRMLSGFGVTEPSFLATRLRTRRKFEPYSVVFVTDDEAAKILNWDSV